MKIRTLSRIKRICKGRPVTLTEYPYFCRITAQDYDFYLDVSIPIHKMSGVRVLQNYYTLSIDVYDKSDFERCEEVATQKRFLIHMFYLAMRSTSDQFYARQMQINYVSEHPEYLEAYNEIYNIKEVTDHES